MEVKTIKLITGEEVVSRVLKEGNYWKLNDPVVAVQTPQGLGLMPFCMTSSDKVMMIHAEHIILMLDTRKELADQYLENVTGLSLSSPSGLAI
jgi:hypothetical protein